MKSMRLIGVFSWCLIVLLSGINNPLYASINEEVNQEIFVENNSENLHSETLGRDFILNRENRTILYDNGPLVTHPGAGSGGADVSRLQFNSLSMQILGFAHQASQGNRIADQFVIPSGEIWSIDDITFFAYQTGSSTTSTITAVNYQIWDGSPDDPSRSVIFGDTTTNRMVSSVWPNLYRDRDDTPGNTSRPIMKNVCTAGVVLSEGTYWLDWQCDGSLSSGPWAPPITILGETVTGDAIQYTDHWFPVTDAGTLTAQGFPFLINGTVSGVETPTPTPLPGDTCSNPFIITSLPYSDNWSTGGYANDYDEVCPYTDSTAPDVVYVYNPGANEYVDIDLCYSDYDTKVYVYENTCGNLVYCNDDYYTDPPCFPYSSRLPGANLYNGNAYYIVVDGYGTNSGDYQLDISIMSTPTMTPTTTETPMPTDTPMPTETSTPTPYDPCEDAYYENGESNEENAFSCDRRVSAGGLDAWVVDDIIITESMTITDVHFWAFSQSSFVFDGTGDIIILADDAGAPGIVLYSIADYSISRMPYSGNWSPNEYVYTFSELNFSLAPGTYWIGFRPVNQTDTGQNFNLSADLVGHELYFKSDYFGYPDWTLCIDAFGISSDIAFCFEGIAHTPTPSPTSTSTAIPSHTPTSTSIPTITPTMIPTDTPIPTCTPTSTSIPTITPTTIPTDTPTSIPTHTFTPIPTDTPLPTNPPPSPPTCTYTPFPSPTETPPCITLGCKIYMPSHDFTPGSNCCCDVFICNPGNETYEDVPVFVLLDVYGLYFFAPDFSEFNHYTMDIPPGQTVINVLPAFPWPEDVGSASGIKWYAAMTDAAITKLFGEFDMFEFGWH